MKPLLLLFLSIVSLTGQELAKDQTTDLLARIVQSRQGVAMQADFREEKHLALMKKPVVDVGTVAFLPPDKFRREVKGKSLTVCDGATLWLYYPEYNNVEKYSLSSNKALRESLAAMTSGFGLQDLAKNYDIAAAKLPDGYQLTLIPKNSRLKKSVTKIIVDLTPAFTARRLEILGAEGDRTVTTFSNEQKAILTPADFTFQPPAGASVSEPLK